MFVVGSVGWPVLDRIRIGSWFAVSPHGLGIAIGFMVGAWLLTKLAPRRGISEEHVSTMIFWALIGAIVGARLFYVIAHLGDFASPLEWLEVWKGGISLLGGIAGAILVNVPRWRHYGYTIFQVLDPAAVALALGIAIGRIGDLVIGDHLGKPTSWLGAWTYHGGTLAPPWTCINGVCQAQLQNGPGGVAQIAEITRSHTYIYAVASNGTRTVVASGIGVHQTAMYDMVLAWILFALLWRLNKKVRRPGILTLTFGLYYGLCRVLEDSLRIDKRFGPFTGSQWTALTVSTISLALLMWWAFHPKPPDEESDDAVLSDEPEQVTEAT
ncbi:MAG: phosphatidylglycerol---prolipoprotein diacylglyceryl transferase [Actinomycetota bacterium]|nr:phosphatidylglycerol---prolipoprotein diacylglyceryl transferase [Actinomycetota bacterium]